MSFDPTDKKWQVTEEFKPDKESKWPFPKEEDGWVKAHDTIRKDIKILIAAFEATLKRGPIKQWEADTIKKLWNIHYNFIEEHHTNEDKICAPFFAKRFIYPEKVSHLGMCHMSFVLVNRTLRVQPRIASQFTHKSHITMVIVCRRSY